MITYPGDESKSLEFKAFAPRKLQALVKTCVAFANGFGGQIIVGVDDQTKQIIGVTDEDRQKLYQDFPNSLFDSTQPSLVAQIYEKSFGDKQVLVVDVPICAQKPYFIKQEGVAKGVYLRVGSSTRRATESYVADLMRERQRLSFDSEVTAFESSILSQALLRDYFGQAVTNKRLIAEHVVGKLASHPEKIMATYAGIILFCEDPVHAMPGVSVICTRFRGTQGRDVIQTQELSGPLATLAHDSFQLIQSWLSQDYTLQGVKLRGKLPIPEVALREAIINALIHRKYSIPGAVKIALYDDRLEIYNPGCFPGLMGLDNLTEGITYLRNPVIAQIARKIGLAEKIGSGIRLIFNACMQAGLKQPEYNENGDFVKITFYFTPVRDPNVPEIAALLEFVKSKKAVTVKDVMAFLSISRNTATRKLNQLIKEKKLMRVGKGPKTHYQINAYDRKF